LHDTGSCLTSQAKNYLLNSCMSFLFTNKICIFICQEYDMFLVEKVISKLLLIETRKQLLKYLQSKMPNTPKYIVQDFFYKNSKDLSQQDIEEFVKQYSNIRWQLKKNFFISYEIFDDDTNRRIKERSGGEKNPFGVPNDKERHEKQKELIKKAMPQEPIILMQNGNKLELVEGWHRTIQLLNLYPEGYRYPNVYIGTK